MMDSYQALMQRLKMGEIILIDGATGTEIERRGVPMVNNAWNGLGAMTHPEVVRGVHEDYIRSGAEIVISNTFSTSRHVLQDAGFEEHFELLNRRGVELVREARANMKKTDVLVAAGIAYLSFTGKTPPPDQLRENLGAQAAIMAEAGADLIMLEMMADVQRTQLAIEAAQETGLPVWVGFSCDLDDSGDPKLLYGSSLVEGIKALERYEIPAITIMHTEVEYIPACLEIVKDTWNKPYGVYAHSGKFVQPNWIFNDVISPGDYASAASTWLEQGIQILGGCCGVGLEHIRVLNGIVSEQNNE